MRIFGVSASPIEKKIRGFSRLRKGWNYGEGLSPSQKTVDEALRVANDASLWGFDVDAFPGSDGEILIAVYHGDECLEFLVESDGSVIYVYEKAGKEVSSREDISLGTALQELDKFAEKRKRKWSISKSSIYNIMTEKGKGLSAWLLRIHQVQASQLSPQSAYALQAEPFVRTYTTTMKRSHPTPLYSGSSPSRIYPTNAHSSSPLTLPVMIATTTY